MLFVDGYHVGDSHEGFSFYLELASGDRKPALDSGHHDAARL